MKCVCGYQIIEDIKALQDQFLDVEVFLESVITDVQTVDWMGKRRSAYLKACPICGTVKLC